jgi:uncharacterized protein (TIGR03437 family)
MVNLKFLSVVNPRIPLKTLTSLILLGLLTIFSTYVIAQVNPTPVTTVSSTNYEKAPVAPESVVSAFGSKLSTSSIAATDTDPSTPQVELPTTLAGTTITVDGKFAGILYVSPAQVNFVIPTGVRIGNVPVKIVAGDGIESNGTLEISTVNPGIFTFNNDGTGVLAANVVRVKADGSQTREALYGFNATTNRYITRPISFGAVTDRIFLEVYLTGIRGVKDPNGDGNLNENVWVLIGGQTIKPAFVGKQGFYAGLDQLNFELPRSLNGKGKMSLAVQAIGGNGSTQDIALITSRVELEVGNPNTGTVPTITGIMKSGGGNSGTVGDTVVISGSGFALNAIDNIVTFGGIKAYPQFADSSHGSLWCNRRTSKSCDSARRIKNFIFI